jgi:hypothetical protein
MKTGLYLNALICFIIFSFSLYTFFYIIRRYKDNTVDRSIAFFWFFVGITWLFVAIDLLIFNIVNINYDFYINQYGVQTAVFLQITAGSYFALFRGTRNKYLSWATVIIFFILSCVGLYFTYQKGGIWFYKSSSFSVEYTFDRHSVMIFQILFGIAMLSMAFDFLRNLYFWLKDSNLFEQKYFLACLSILIYGMVGYFDQIGIFANWVGVLFRLAIVFCVHITYLAYSDKEI